jgi:peroxiredoxin 2/4
MYERAENRKGPALGAPAPYFSKGKNDEGTSLNKFLGNWVILFSHPDELFPIFRTRTINYILCKRRIRAVAIGDGRTPDVTTRINFLEKYLVKHSLSIIEDADCRIAKGYGLDSPEVENAGKGVFVIDPKGHLRMKLYFSQEAERDFMDILKLIDALQAADKQSKQKNSADGKNSQTGRPVLTIAVRKTGAFKI